jgi:hypothetical protein
LPVTGFRDTVEDGLGLEQTVEVTNTGMVTADQHVVDAVVLTEGGMEQAFAGTGITHIQRITGGNDMLLDEVVLDQDVDALIRTGREYRRA